LSSLGYPSFRGGGAGGGGEANDGQNVGAGVQLFKNKTGVLLNFRTIIDSSKISWVQNADDVIATIVAASLVDADINAGANIAKSKLAALNIVNADIAAGANIDKTKISTTGTWLKSELPSTTVFTDQANTFGDFLQTFEKIIVTNALPRYILEESDQAANTKKWAIESSGSVFSICAINDAETTAIKAIQILRDAGSNEIDKIKLKTAAGVARLTIEDTVVTHNSGVNLEMGTNLVKGIKSTQYVQNTITYNATLAFDFNNNEKNQVTLTGVLSTLTTSNRAAGKSIQIFIVGDSVDRLLTFNTSWKTNPSDATVTVTANTFGVLSLYCRGTAETDVFAVYVEFS